MPSYRYHRPSVTADCVVFGFLPGDALRVLLVTRKGEPFKGKRALPGGFVQVKDTGNQGESLEAAALRELREETGVTLSHIEQLFTFGDPGRDPRGRVITVAHLALVGAANYEPQSGSDAADVEWVPAAEALSEKLAFDHNEILSVGLARLRAKVRYAPIGLELMPETFTLAELRELYEALLGRPLDVSNFAKQAKATGVLRATGKKRNDGYRPAELYKFDRAAYAKQSALGVEFKL